MLFSYTFLNILERGTRYLFVVAELNRYGKEFSAIFLKNAFICINKIYVKDGWKETIASCISKNSIYQQMLKLILFYFILQNTMDDSDPPRSYQPKPSALDKKKKYTKVDKKGDQGPLKFTQVPVKPPSNFDFSSIRKHGTASLANSNLQDNIQGLENRRISKWQPETQEPETYQNCKQKIDDKSWLNVIKKYIKKAFVNIKNIEILYTSTKPSLMFHFSQDDNKAIKKIALKDIIKANKYMGRHEAQTIEDIFDRLYFRVSEEFHKIMQLVIELADIKRVDLNLPSEKSVKIPLLYYCINKKSTNFTLFDRDMRIFEFSGHAIKELSIGSRHQKLCKKFEEIVQNKRRQEERVIEQYGEYEASSSDQEPKPKAKYYQKGEVQAVKNHLWKILQMNLNDYEDEISELESQFYELRRRDDYNSKAEIEKIADDLGELQSNLENFKQTADEVEQLEPNLRPSDIQGYKNLLKKMILAKKQLQNKLPITAKKREIFNELDREDLIILQGQTGSGKSTQLPQMMCEYFRIFDEKGKATLPILITQPRKLATRTVAERVASEMEEKIGGFVDYATSPHKPVSKTARIIFKMDALVLDEITVDRMLSKYSCLIIDEAHERTISIDVILGLIKELQTKRKNFKVIVTSASLDAKLFSDYFKKKVMKVSGRLYPVEVIHKKMHETDAVRKIEKVIKDDILINGSEIRKEYKGDVLVFCSGVEEINRLCEIFQKYVNPRVFQVYPLHGRIAPQDQKRIFLQTKEHKLIFASRIAETSITINGVKVVVDPGFDREEVYDQKNRVSSRKLVNISQSSAKQRAGRAGRTSKGYCFRLYTQAEMQGFRSNKTPEIENMALDTLVLRLKMLNVQEIFKFAYVNKPDDKALEKSVETLQMIGALSLTGEITTVGKLLLQLRIEPFLGRAIVQAIVCEQIIKKTNYADKELRKSAWKETEIQKLQFTRQSIIEILSMVINSSNVFTFLPQFDTDRDNMDEVKFKKFSDERGDFFYLLNIYDEYIYRTKKQKSHELNNWIRSRFLNKKTLNQVKELVAEINDTVKNFNFDLKDQSSKKLVDIIKVRMSYCKNADDVILSCMMTSFCVNLCLYSNNPSIGYTLILQKKPIAIYGTSTLALLSKFPKWIICYDLKTNDKGMAYCQIAHEVDYDFMKRTVDDQVFEKLNLKQAQKMNPFYQTIQRQLPTLILYEINWEFLNRHQSKKQIFKYFPYLSLILNEQTNSISISWSKQLRIQDINRNSQIKDSNKLRQQFQTYIDEKILEKKGINMSFHLISNINLQMAEGFIVKSVYFTSKEVDHQVQADQTTITHLTNFLQSQHFRCKKITRQKIKISTIYQEQYEFVQSFLYNNGLNAVQLPRQKRQSKLNAKIYIHINTGWKKDSNVYMGYPRQKDSIYRIQKILQEAKKRQRRQQEKQYLSYIKILCQSQFRIDKNQSGILCTNPDIDAFQLQEAMQYLARYGILPWDFKFPQFYSQYRDIDYNLAVKSEKEWQKEIEKIFESYGFKNISIKVKSDDRVRNQQQLYNMEKMIKNKLVAQLSGQNIQVLDKIIKNFDGYSTIGAGRNHFRYNFKQFIAKVNINAFRALYDAFDYQKQKFQAQTAQLRIQTYQQTVGKVPHVFIKCRSPDREKLLQPSVKIKQLFTPYILRLQAAQFNLLINTPNGEYHIEDIQDNYNHQIYFGPDKKKNQLKIYCNDQNIDQITQRIMGFFERYDIYVERISYRGKGLNRVINLIEKEIKYIKSSNKAKSNQFLEYKIIFKSRQIQLEGDAVSINNIKGDISSLVNEEPGSCHICMRNTQRPYRLFNCSHSFCWKCLGDYLQQSRKDETNEAEILCPEDKCQKHISAYDMRGILSAEEFQQFSFKKLRGYVNNTSYYFFCPTSGCNQLFQGVSVAKDNSFQCFMCGKWYCSKCKQPHQNFTCTEWATKLVNGQLKKYGFIRCKCRAVLHKQVRENIIQCKQCRQYLCWTCIKGWKLQRDCKNHIQTCKMN